MVASFLNRLPTYSDFLLIDNIWIVKIQNKLSKLKHISICIYKCIYSHAQINKIYIWAISTTDECPS